MIHGNYYEERLGPGITADMAHWVREGDPEAILYLNDYDILTGVRLDDYLKHIRMLLEQKVPIGGIGVQGHLHAESFDPKALHHALAKLSQFKLPIRITEFNIPGQRSRFYKDRSLRLTDDDERAKAQGLVDYYRICFAYPQVAGILMWGFWEGANWIPVSSLYRRDWRPLPAAAAYHNLIFDEWWTRWKGHADEHGRCEVPVFYGQHNVKAAGKEQVVRITKREGRKTITVK
jgi:GH35 family endo-1,4-beta-xylanase